MIFVNIQRSMPSSSKKVRENAWAIIHPSKCLFTRPEFPKILHSWQCLITPCRANYDASLLFYVDLVSRRRDQIGNLLKSKMIYVEEGASKRQYLVH